METDARADFDFIKKNQDDEFYYGKYVAINRGLPIVCKDSRQEVRDEMRLKHPELCYMIHYFPPPPPPRRIMAEPHFMVQEEHNFIEVNERERIYFIDGTVYVYLPCGDWCKPESFIIGTYSNANELKQVMASYYRKIADIIEAHELKETK